MASFNHPNAGGDFGRIDTSQLERVAQNLVQTMQQLNTIAAWLNAYASKARQLAAATAAAAASAQDPAEQAGARAVVAMLGNAATQCQQAAASLTAAHSAGMAWASQAVARSGG